MKDQIRKLYLAGYSLRGISKGLKLSRNTVRKYFRLGCEESGSPQSSQLSWWDAIDWQMLGKKRQ